MEAEAQRDERGKNTATEVRTLEPIAGLETKYWRIEKIAGDIGQLARPKGDRAVHTWNDESLAAHDEKDLHRTKLS